MKTSKYLLVGMLAVCGLCSCSNDEEPIDNGTAKNIELSAGISTTTRAVIDADYSKDLHVTLASLDHPSSHTK